MLKLLTLPFLCSLFLVSCSHDGEEHATRNTPLNTSSAEGEQTVVQSVDQEILNSESGILNSEEKAEDQKFLHDKLTTNTSKSSIPLDEILGGGPGKDGIPAIDEPIFLTQEEAESDMSYLSDDDEGVVVVGDDEARFYSFDILVWHEIVNDEIDGENIAVTFCPLCGSSITYKRTIDSEVIRFGVSGKLYNSNLLMYDDLTESLWSQSIGEAVVGDKLGTQLELYRSDIMSYGSFKNLYPKGVVLSDDTGEWRTYGRQPYGNYADNDDLYFPVNHEDVRLPRKTLLYIINDGDLSVAFVRSGLVEVGEASIQIEDKIYTAVYRDGSTIVTESDRTLPGYHEMWFSWITHNQNTKDIWGIED